MSNDNSDERNERQDYLDQMIEVERLKNELNELVPYKMKYLDSVKADLLNGFNVNEEQRAFLNEKLEAATKKR